MKYSIGCLQMTPGTNTFNAVDGKGNTNTWETRTANATLIALLTAPGGTIISLAIIYDDGAKSMVPGPGFVYLDNIEVCTASCKLWTQPSDNSEH